MNFSKIKDQLSYLHDELERKIVEKIKSQKSDTYIFSKERPHADYATNNWIVSLEIDYSRLGSGYAFICNLSDGNIYYSFVTPIDTLVAICIYMGIFD